MGFWMRVNELAVLVAHDRKKMQQEGNQKRQFSHEIKESPGYLAAMVNECAFLNLSGACHILDPMIQKSMNGILAKMALPSIQERLIIID